MSSCKMAKSVDDSATESESEDDLAALQERARLISKTRQAEGNASHSCMSKCKSTIQHIDEDSATESESEDEVLSLVSYYAATNKRCF